MRTSSDSELLRPGIAIKQVNSSSDCTRAYETVMQVLRASSWLSAVIPGGIAQLGSTRKNVTSSTKNH
jgi:hypothetical protein